MKIARALRASLPVGLCLGLLGLSSPALADFQDSFTGPLGGAWTTSDGYALQEPADTANHAHFTSTGSQLSIAFPGGEEHNQWLLRHAQAVRNYEGSGVYEIKVDSSVTGTQQFGIVFQRDPSNFMMFMFYGTSQVHAYIERFAYVEGQLYKSTVAGAPLGLGIPAAGPYYLRVTVADNTSPSLRTWKFDWSQNGSSWNEIFAGVYEGPDDTDHVGAISKVGVFAGNQPDDFDGFDARFDYFKYSSAPDAQMPAPASLITRPSNQRVDLWWNEVAAADSYSVYVSTGGAYSLLSTTTAPSFSHLSATNGTKYTYAVTARLGATQSVQSQPASAVPHAITGFSGLPQTGLSLLLSATELAYVHTNGQPVGQWVSAIGPANYATATTGRMPTFIASSVNDKPALRFDGVDDFLSLTGNFSDFTQGMSAFVVLHPTVLQSGFKILALGNGAGADNIVLGRAGSTAGLQYFTNNSANNVAWFNTSEGAVAGEPSVVTLMQEGGAQDTLSFAEVGRDGVPIFGSNVWVAPVKSRSVNFIGKSYWNEGIFQGDVAEVILYNRMLNTTEQTAVFTYISQKYGITTAGPPPPAVVPPAGVTAVANNGSVSLSWAATAGATGYRVQRATSPTGSYLQIADVTGTSISDSAVINGTNYYYAVKAYNTGHESGLSKQVFALPRAPLPAIPTSGLMLSLNAASLSTQFGHGESVTTWQDQSGAGNNATAGGAAPALISNAIGGSAAVRFDGIDDFLSFGAGFQNLTAGMSLYIVARPTGLQHGFKLLALGNGPGQDNIVLGRAGSTAGFQYFTNNSSNDVTWFNTDSGLVQNQATLLSVLQGGGAANSTQTAQVQGNGIALNAQGVYVPPVLTRSVNYLGKSYWAEGMFQGDIAEVLLYNRTLTPTEQGAVQTYVEQKYGIDLP